MQVEVITWYLEMLDPQQFRPKYVERPDLQVMQAIAPSPAFSRFLYTSVGGAWYWVDRLSWTFDRWLAYLDRPELQTWVAYLAGTPAGYVELEAQPKSSVEIAYFGLLPQFIGQQIGGHLLSVGIRQAWAMNARRVWVHTCSLDGPHALANYEARGLQLYDQQVHLEELPERPIGPWSGADEAQIRSSA